MQAESSRAADARVAQLEANLASETEAYSVASARAAQFKADLAAEKNAAVGGSSLCVKRALAEWTTGMDSCSRREVIESIDAYAKAKGLVDRDDGRRIHVDAKLSPLFPNMLRVDLIEQMFYNAEFDKHFEEIKSRQLRGGFRELEGSFLEFERRRGGGEEPTAKKRKFAGGAADGAPPGTQPTCVGKPLAVRSLGLAGS